MTATVTVDVAGAQMGGAARFGAELWRYLDRTGRTDVRVIGATRRVSPAWLVGREGAVAHSSRRIALNNVGFIGPGGERWTLLRNALHFLTEGEIAGLDSSLRDTAGREAAVVRLAARRADVLVVPSTAMAERVARLLPGAQGRIVVRPHPVSADAVPRLPREAAILCPVLFAPYKQMGRRLAELLAATESVSTEPLRIRVTASAQQLPDSLAGHPRLEAIGQLDQPELRQLWGRSQAIYFPTGLESFGYPLAEARVSGQPVIARDTQQNREIAGRALFGFSPGDPDSLRCAVTRALDSEVAPDPKPFDPDRYFTWMLGGR